MIHGHVRKICDRIYFVDAHRRFVLKCIRNETKLKYKKDVSKTAVCLVLGLRVTQPLGWLCPSCQTQYIVTIFVI